MSSAAPRTVWNEEDWAAYLATYNWAFRILCVVAVIGLGTALISYVAHGVEGSTGVGSGLGSLITFSQTGLTFRYLQDQWRLEGIALATGYWRRVLERAPMIAALWAGGFAIWGLVLAVLNPGPSETLTSDWLGLIQTGVGALLGFALCLSTSGRPTPDGPWRVLAKNLKARRE